VPAIKNGISSKRGPVPQNLELAQQIFKSSYLTGDFLLRSGQRSTEYFDKYRFECTPTLLRAIAKEMAKKIPAGTEVLAGLELGGVPLATALSLETGLPTCLVRKKAKDYGTCKIAEGFDVKNKKVLIIEDVISTGGQVLLSTADLRQAGAIVDSVICVILRAEDHPLASANLRLQYLFTMNELKGLKR
jgi:orotate phosphoribosyltransferase